VFNIQIDGTSQSTSSGSANYTWPVALTVGSHTWGLSSSHPTALYAESTSHIYVTAITPAPVITALAIDCGTSCTPFTGESNVTFYVTNATSCEATSVSSGLGGNGTPGSVSVTGNSGSFIFNTNGTAAGNNIEITVSCDGLGGNGTNSFYVPINY